MNLYNNSTSQWDNLLLNLGCWKGSFTQLSPQGEVQSDTASLVSLEELNDENRTIRQTIQHVSSTGEITYNKVLEYSSLNRSVLFFEDGSFSQGSIQFAPFSEFGAELGFISGDRRLRLVQLFDKDSHLSNLTLIREHRQNTEATERPHLSIEMLQGEWHGDAITLYPDWSTPTRYSTMLSVWRNGDRVHQRLSAPQFQLESSATINGSILRFDEGNHPMQLLLLPDGASSNTPLVIPRGQPFLLEAGWLLSDTLRQRMIRSYDARGGWVSLTLVTEHKVS